MASNELKVSPDKYFQDWEFDIPRSYWSICGCKRASWIDKTKSKTKRDLLKKDYISQGMGEDNAQKLSMKKGKVMRTGWGLYKIDPFDFSEGYSILSSKRNERIRIIENKDNQIVVALYQENPISLKSIGFIKYKDFSNFLKFGDASVLNHYDPRQMVESNYKYLLISAINSLEKRNNHVF